MSRALSRFTLPVALLTLALSACSDSDPQQVTLAELVANAQRYDGDTVHTRGMVKSFDEPRHYWLEDDNINRVGLEPMDEIAPHLDRRISVTGHFTYSPDRGRRIRIESIGSYDEAR